MPRPLSLMQSHALHQFHWPQIGKVHLVGEDQNWTVGHIGVVHNAIQCFPSQFNALHISRIEHVDDGIGASVVVMPQFSESGLSSDIPDSERQSFVVNLLHIESHCRHRSYSLIQFHLVEDGGLSSTIEAQHEDLGLHVGEGVEQFEDELTHLMIMRRQFPMGIYNGTHSDPTQKEGKLIIV